MGEFQVTPYTYRASFGWPMGVIKPEGAHLGARQALR